MSSNDVSASEANAALFSERLGKVSIDLETAPNLGAVREALREALTLFDAEFYLVIMRPGAHSNCVMPMVLTNYPKNLQVQYNALEAWSYDPIIFRASQTDSAFTWEDLFLTPPQIALAEMMSQNRIVNGITAAHRGLKTCHAMLSFAGPSVAALQPAAPELRATAMTMLTAQAYRVLSRLLSQASRPNAPSIVLTEREKQTVTMLARGETHRTIADCCGALNIDPLRGGVRVQF